ncbi:MAG: phosphoribosylformylglycinamidine synthase subunit PurL [Acidimicrobiales bacterium]|nr:phosphoribosylformylglycinamidine synthase subunit PurL [Acidimicrobiales bacterium]
MSEPVHRALGLTDDEAEKITELLGREPNHLELAMYSVMWSEHCSYKSSRIHLKRLPTEAPWVLVGPGENAGVVDVGDGIAAAIRIESHNHPSAIEPYQGAATGVGGILRDIFTMGARPIALMDPLRFGPLDDPRSRWIAEGVVSGVSGYGNSVGVPTVGGETVFDETYRGNPLVNVLCLGILPTERLVLAKASGVGNLAVLLGSRTGRDGIGGVSVLASAGFSDDEADAAKRPSVQVGDPFEEKRLIEACLTLLDEGLVVGIQDLGGAGLTCAASETASNGGVGMDFDVSAVPRREDGMEPFEVMTSESQERMLAIVTPEGVDRVRELCSKWEVEATVVGRVTEGGALRIVDGFEGEELANVPASTLHEDAPLYDRPRQAPADLDAFRADSANHLPAPDDVGADLKAMLIDPEWVYSQYDHQLFLNTVVGPGADATLLRLKHPTTGEETGRGLALTVDGNHRWCAIDPKIGTAATMAEALLNLACVGAKPLATVNCLNFGNPEHPEVMWQLSEAIDGMTEACEAFGAPVVGGNVSLYNESLGTNIDPTPVIGLLGMVDDLRAVPPGLDWLDGDRLILLGATESDELSGSQWAFEQGHRRGRLAPVDLGAVASVADLVRSLVNDRMVTAVHDVSVGGLGVALAEMAVASNVGCTIARVADHAALFCESPGRVVVSATTEQMDDVLARADAAGVPTTRLGLAHGDRLAVKGLLDLAVDELTTKYRETLPAALGQGTTQG